MKKRRRKNGTQLFPFALPDLPQQKPKREEPAPEPTRELIRREPIRPDKVEIIPHEDDPSWELGNPYGSQIANHVSSDGPNFHDKGSFVIQEYEYGWRAVGNWQAEGKGRPPFLLKLIASFASFSSNILDHQLNRPGRGTPACGGFLDVFEGDAEYYEEEDGQ